MSDRQTQLLEAARDLLGAWDALETEDGGEPSAALREAMRPAMEELRACAEALQSDATPYNEVKR